jgi:hypothetical protein
MKLAEIKPGRYYRVENNGSTLRKGDIVYQRYGKLFVLGVRGWLDNWEQLKHTVTDITDHKRGVNQ